MTILMIDREEMRRKVISGIIAAAAGELFKNGTIREHPLCIRCADRFEYYDYSKRLWLNLVELPDSVTLQLRHETDNDRWMPPAVIKIKYTGGQFGALNSDTEWGIPFQISSDDKLVPMQFTHQHARQILEYTACRGEFPECLRPNTYNKALENKLSKRMAFLGKNGWKQIPYFESRDILNTLPHPPHILIAWPYSLPDTAESMARVLLEKINAEWWSENCETAKVRVIGAIHEWEATDDFSTYDVAILPAELVWNKKEYHTRFSGITQALIQLRRKRFAGAAILASMAPAVISLHLYKRQQGFDVLNLGFHYLWDISAVQDGGLSYLTGHKSLEEAWEAFLADQKAELQEWSELKVHRMTPRRMEDVRLQLLSEGKFSAIYHEFKETASFTTQMDAIIEAATNAFQDIEHLIPAVSLLQYRSEVSNTLEEMSCAGDLNAAFALFLSKRQTIRHFLPVSSGQVIQPEAYVDRQSWGALLVEDDPQTARLTAGIMEKAGIRTWVAADAITALHYLDEDRAGRLRYGKTQEPLPPHFITVVIADARLEKGNGRWGLIQGYDLIDRITYLPSLIACIMFTQKESLIIRAGQDNQKLHAIWLSKEILRLPDTRDILVEKVMQLGKDAFHTLSSMPKTTLWISGYLNVHDHPFCLYYKWHRDAPQYAGLEDMINQTAENLLKLWIGLLSPDPDLKKAAHYREAALALFPMQSLTTGLRENKSQEENEKLFCAKLAARRTALGILKYFRWSIAQNAPLFTKRPPLHEDDLVFEVSLLLTRHTRSIGVIEHPSMLAAIPTQVLSMLRYYYQIEEGEELLKKHIHDMLNELAQEKKLEIYPLDLSLNQDLFNKHLGMTTHIADWETGQLIEEKIWLESLTQQFLQWSLY